MRYLLAALSMALASLGACTSVDNPVSGKTERTVMDERSEIEQGRQQHQQVLAEYGAVKDSRLQAYVNDVGQQLARNSHRATLEWHFTVLDSDEVNAFALPGGFIYITRGIMAYLDSEADLAGVLGHEIGHVTARHGAQRATRQQQAGLGVLAATVLGALLEGRGVGGASDIASQLSQTVAAGYIASYSREQELQADKLGAEYLARAKYNPTNMVDIIRVLKDQERFEADQARAEGRSAGSSANWLASHPSNDQRLRDIEHVAVQYKASYADDGRTRYQQAINGLAFGESRDQGVTRGRNFYHEGLGFALTAPAGWKIMNSASSLVVANGAGNAGLIVQAVPPQSGTNHEEILRKGLHAEDGRTDRLTINGFPATHYSGTRRNAQGQQQPLEATIVTGPGNRHFALLYAARDAQTLAQNMGPLRETESSLRPLNAADRIAARPWTLRSVPYPRGGFALLARQSPLPSPERQLRLLNGVYAGGEPIVGQLIKVVE